MSLEQKRHRELWLPAFTLMETLVSMALMGILCASGYYAMGLVEKHYSLFQQNNNALYTYQHLAQCLQHDIESASMVKRSNNILTCQRGSYFIYYTFEENMVCRSSSSYPAIRDTFPLVTKNMNTSFSEIPVDMGVIDELEIHLVQFEKEERLLLFKSYSSKQLMQIEQR